ncbi:MAG TPA: hypothetical protein VL463_21575 [Kofleriaceae bacterium]|nr:hypothetical protein [Kofleriaceae bacterium]
MKRIVLATAALAACSSHHSSATDDGGGGVPDTNITSTAPTDPVKDAAAKMIDEGRHTFRYDTFGDEAFWGGTLRLHEAVATLSPKAALGLGLKVDVDALPGDVVAGVKNGSISLDDPKTTLALLQANAVVGVTGFVDNGKLTSIGIQCALCHSTVDDSVAPGLGHRLDGWPNRDLDVGQIIAAAPDLSSIAQLLDTDQDTVRTVLKSWGPGKFDAELILDGKAMRPDGKPAATLIPPAFGLQGVNLHTWTGWGSIPYWNAFVAVLEMHGKGTFFDPRLDDAQKFPIAAKNHFGHVTTDDDRVTEKLPALHAYQLALRAPAPPAGSFDADAAERGDQLFGGKAKCTRCHTDELYTEPGWDLHRGAEVGVDDFQAMRSPDGMYRTSPLHGLWAHQKGGFFHDGRFATLADVVAHYDQLFTLGLTANEQHDLVEYLKSL